MSKLRRHNFVVLAALAACCAVPALATAGNGGVSPNDPQYAPPKKAKIVENESVLSYETGVGHEQYQPDDF